MKKFFKPLQIPLKKKKIHKQYLDAELYLEAFALLY